MSLAHSAQEDENDRTVPGHGLGRRWNDRATDATPHHTCAAPSDRQVHLVLGEIQLGGEQVRRGKTDRPTDVLAAPAGDLLDEVEEAEDGDGSGHGQPGTAISADPSKPTPNR
jgi:hypothetical protein